MNFINNPFNIIEEVIKENYPNVVCDIYFGNQTTDGVNQLGCTIFPDEEFDTIQVEIHPTLNLINATEILAHELAHVIAGKEAEHNEEWERIFEDINVKFQQKVYEKYSS